MRFCSLKFQNLVRKIDLVNRRWLFYWRAYGIAINVIPNTWKGLTFIEMIFDKIISVKLS